MNNSCHNIHNVVAASGINSCHKAWYKIVNDFYNSKLFVVYIFALNVFAKVEVCNIQGPEGPHKSQIHFIFW